MKARVNINNIAYDQGIYPRFSTDTDRIKYFFELLECGVHFPPLKVVKHDNLYVLLDGNHRLGAYRLADFPKVEVELMEIEKQHWRLAAARFNNLSSKPLQRDEIKNTILKAWEVDGIRDAREIAHHLGCTEQYARRVLKNVIQKTKKERNYNIKELRDQGFSIRETADKLGIPKSTVCDIENRVSENEPVSFSDTSDNSGPYSLEGRPVGEMRWNVFNNLLWLNYQEGFDDWVVSDIKKINTWIKPIHELPLRAAFLINCGLEVSQIAQKTGKSNVWVRSIAAALMAIYHWNKHPDGEKSPRQIADIFKIKEIEVDLLHGFSSTYKSVVPARALLYVWLRQNMPPHRDKAITDIYRLETIYFYCLERNKTLPWEPALDNPPLDEIPEDIEQQFRETIEFFQGLCMMTEARLFRKEKILKRMLFLFNMFQVKSNEFHDLLNRESKGVLQSKENPGR